jgi:DNA helicase-2/ATP-dependent DNA helicase PcrA
MDLLDGLNHLQQEAVQADEGPILVHAGPGSGKTRVITHRIAYLVMHHRVNPRSILAVTFSRKAAGEMKKRLTELMGGVVDNLSLGTFHSICLAILRKEGIPGLGTTFDVVDDDAQTKLIKECIDLAGFELDGGDLKRIKGVISYAKCSLIDPDTIVPKPGERLDETATAVFRLYQKKLRQQRALDYDDMLVHAHRLFKENDAVLKRYQQRWRYILVDEFQDTSKLQYEIIKALALKFRNIFVVGDPDQTIYSWRQADIHNLASFKKDFPDARVIGMEENYRSTKNIVDAANALISRNTITKDKKLRTSREKGARLSMVKLADEMQEASFVSGELSRLARERKLDNSSFAVLYRINAQSRALEEAFSGAAIPYRLVGGTPFYKRREVMDMLAWLRVIRNPADDTALMRIIKLSGKGIGSQTLAGMAEQAQVRKQHLYNILGAAASGKALTLQPKTQRALAKFHALIEDLRVSSRKSSLPDLLNQVIEKSEYRQQLEGEEDGEERWENVSELISMTARYKHLPPSEALGSLVDKVNHLSATSEDKNNADAVSFHTLHGAKGTEYPVVFIVGAEEGLLPHSKSLLEENRLEEERRLCYVGITRAMDLVYLTHVEKRLGQGGESYRTASRFLRELPPGLVAARDFTATPKLSSGDRPAVTPAPAKITMELQEGNRVRHPKFGEGRVAGIEDSGREHYITVEFQGGIFRKFAHRLAGLEKLPEI